MTTGEKMAGTTEDAEAAVSQQMRENLDKIEGLTQRLVQAMSQRKPHVPALDGPGWTCI